MKNPTDVVPVTAEAVGRQAADVKSLTDTVVEVAAEVVGHQAAEVIVTDVVPDHQVAAAKTSKKRRILFNLTY